MRISACIRHDHDGLSAAGNQDLGDEGIHRALALGPSIATFPPARREQGLSPEQCCVLTARSLASCLPAIALNSGRIAFVSLRIDILDHGNITYGRPYV